MESHTRVQKPSCLFAVKTLPSHPTTPTPIHTPSPRQPLIYFLSFQMCLFWVFHVTESYNMWCFAWPLSFNTTFLRLIRMGACISTGLLFIAGIVLHCIDKPRSVCLFTSSWTFGFFHLGIFLPMLMLLWTFTYKSLCGHNFSFLLGSWLGVEFLGHPVTLCLIF